MNRPLLTEMRLAHLLTLEPRPMTQRLIALDGGAYAWTDDADLHLDAGAVILRRPRLEPVTLWRPTPGGDFQRGRSDLSAADVIRAILAALDTADGFGVVDVGAVAARLEGGL